MGEKTVKVSLTNEARKFLYNLLSNVFVKTVDDMVVLDELFASFEKTAIDYDVQHEQLKNLSDRLNNQYSIQLKNNATEVQLKQTIADMEKMESKMQALAGEVKELPITQKALSFGYSNIVNIIQMNRLDKEKRAEGISGRHNVRLTKNILQEFVKYI